MLITYGIVSASYIQFYKKLYLARAGRDPSVGDIDPSFYDRSHPSYPFRSRWQPYTAYYATTACTLIVLFNGWGTLVPPFATGDFFGCYSAVRHTLSHHLRHGKLGYDTNRTWHHRLSSWLLFSPLIRSSSSPRRTMIHEACFFWTQGTT